MRDEQSYCVTTCLLMTSIGYYDYDYYYIGKTADADTRYTSNYNEVAIKIATQLNVNDVNYCSYRGHFRLYTSSNKSYSELLTLVDYYQTILIYSTATTSEMDSIKAAASAIRKSPKMLRKKMGHDHSDHHSKQYNQSGNSCYCTVPAVDRAWRRLASFTRPSRKWSVFLRKGEH